MSYLLQLIPFDNRYCSVSYKVNGNSFSWGNEEYTTSGTYVIEGDVLKLTRNGGGTNIIQLKRMTGAVLNKYNNAVEGYN